MKFISLSFRGLAVFLVYFSPLSNASANLVSVQNLGTTYVDNTTSGGPWVLLGYGANGNLGSLLTATNGTFDSARQGSATLDALAYARSSAKLAISWNQTGKPNGGITSYTHAVAFSFADPSLLTLTAAATPSDGSGSTNWSKISTDPSTVLLNVETLHGSPNLPSSMYARRETFGARYGGYYGFANTTTGNNQLDWGPDSQAFTTLFLGTNADGFYAGGAGGTQNGYVPSTMAIWAKMPTSSNAGNQANVTYTFTNAGATGREGPTQSQINTNYSGTNLQGKVTINTQGIQEWTVPATGTYRIEVLGAKGGNGTVPGSGGIGHNTPGKGAYLAGNFVLTSGDLIKILVGQAGESASGDGGGGGGGGTFVVKGSSTPLIVAGGGGGGGGRTNQHGVNASLSTSGTQSANNSGTPGQSGQGGSGGGEQWGSGGGGGFLGDGGNGGNPATGGLSFSNGGTGGQKKSNYPAVGGFGGGGGVAYSGGGGGGYSGGAGGPNGEPYPAGGGGGSYNSGTEQNSTAGANAGHGRVIITALTPLPFDLNATSLTIAENQSAGTVVGAISAIDSDDNFAFEVSAHTSHADTADTGGGVNVAFLVNGSWTSGESFFTTSSKGDVETKAFTTVAKPTKLKFTAGSNDAWGCWKIVFAGKTILQNPNGSAGSASGTAPYWVDGDNDAGMPTTQVHIFPSQSHVFSLVDGNGSTGNAFFTLETNGTLKTAVSLDYEANASHSIRVRATDELNASVEKSFTVSVTDDTSESSLPQGTTYVFTNAGATGREGPTQSQVNANYSGTNLASAVTINTRGIQEWTVPADGNYTIEAWGAAGGNSSLANNAIGGKGAILRGTFELTKDEVIKVLVGQVGEDSSETVSGKSAGGGGGSFVIRSPHSSALNSILVIAGGGGGSGFDSSHQSNSNGDGGSASNAGTAGKGNSPGNAGTSGNAGGQSTSSGTSGGAGYLQNSQAYNNWATAASSFLNGGAGSDQTGRNSGSTTLFGGDGGFGSGGAGAYGGGGGGGFSGGGSGHYGSGGDYGGGGGGSYNSGTDQNNTAGANAGHGRVVIQYLGSSASPLDIGLVAWYPLNGNGTDHSPTANHATVNGTTPTADRHGVAGKALLFDGSGSNHYLEAAFNQALSSTAISYSVWTKPTSTTSNHGSPITFRADGRGFNLYKLPDNTWSHWTGNGGWQKFHAQAISLNWTALAFTHDGTTGKAYQNGVLVVSSNKTYLPAQSGSLKIGAGTGGSGPTYFFKGAIDEVRIWNRVLSAEEISSLYTMEKPANSAPTDLNSTAALAFSENQTAGTVVGDFNATDPDANATLSFSLLSGANLFSLDTNGTLRTLHVLDYETNSTSYAISVRVTDQHNASLDGNFTVALLNQVEDLDGDGTEDHYDSDDDGDGFSDAIEIAYGSDPRDSNSVANAPPTALVLNDSNVSENQPAGTVIGDFNATDPDAQATLSFSLLSGANLFSLDANGTLRTLHVLDYETNSTSYAISVRVTDQHNASLDGNFTVALLNQVEDLDGDGTEDHYDSDDDGDGFSDAIEIAYGSDPRDSNSVANATPTALVLNDSNVSENQPAGTVIGDFNATDPDAQATLSFSLLSGANLFSLDANGTLRTLHVLDYETNASSYAISVRVTDEHNASLDGNFTIALLNQVEDLDGDGTEDHYDSDDDGDGYSDATEIAYGSDPRNAQSLANSAPSTLDLNGSTILENQPAGTLVGNLFATDPDANATLSFSLVDGNGSQDNALFRIEGASLRTLAIFDYEANAMPPASTTQNGGPGFELPGPGPGFPHATGEHDSTHSHAEDNATRRIGQSLGLESQPTRFHVRVRVTDEHNASLEKAFVIDLLNQVEDFDGDGIEDAFDPDDVIYLMPQLGTIETTVLENGRVSLSAGFTANSDFALPAFSFELSGSPDFNSTIRTVSALVENGRIHASLVNLKSGSTYHARILATHRSKSTRSPSVSFQTASEIKNWWESENPSENGWRTSPWFGYFLPQSNGWIYHLGLGWVYAQPDGQGGLWLWMDAEGWVWSAPHCWPHLWKDRSNNWLYFVKEHEGKPALYDYSTESFRWK